MPNLAICLTILGSHHLDHDIPHYRSLVTTAVFASSSAVPFAGTPVRLGTQHKVILFF